MVHIFRVGLLASPRQGIVLYATLLLFVSTLAAEPADWIWSARYVITEDARHRVIENGAVAVRGDRIVGVGSKGEIDARFQATQRLDRPDAILAPGLINTHTHAPMSLFRGVADDMNLQDWLNKFIFPAEALKFTERYLARFHNDPLVVAAVAPHALYTNSDETLKASRALANRYNAPLIIHLSETKRENDDAIKARKMTPTKILDTLGVLTGRTVAAHCVWVGDADLSILKARGVGVAHCPSSNMKLASGVAPVVKMLALNLAVGLGPDGPAGSNNDFNLFEEMDLAAKLQKVTTGDPQALPAAAALEMATIRGARVLGMEKEIGSVESGKRADLILVRTDRPNAVPMYDPISQMVYALKASDVRDVMVNGKPVVRDGAIRTLNQAQILQKAAEYRVRISASLK